MAEVRPNRRRRARVSISLPVRVAGRTPDGRAWEEIASTEDASLHGLRIHMAARVETGEILHLTLPMPPQLRLYDDSEPTYSIYGLVCGAMASSEAQRVRVHLLGKQPPRGHAAGPAMRYEVPSGPAVTPQEPAERRQTPRYDVFVDVSIRRLPANGGQSERTVTENLSACGARVPTTLTLSPGETLSVTELGGDFHTEAVARGVYFGRDRVRRVNLRFVSLVPRRLIAAPSR